MRPALGYLSVLVPLVLENRIFTNDIAWIGRDMASYSPKWLTIRRCSYIIACLGICTNPWQITTTAATFIQVSGPRIYCEEPLGDSNVLSI